MASDTPTSRWRITPSQALIAVCVVHGLLPLLLVGVHHTLGIDETVYVTQYNGHIPPGLWSAPRSRGVPLLVAPITLWSSSLVVLRVYLALLSMAGLYLALLPWQRLRRGWSTPLAGAVFSSLWVTIYYSFEAMPNEWSAYCALAAVGLLLRYRQTGRSTALVGMFVALALMGLMRPVDSLWLGVPLVIAAFVLPAMARAARIVVAGAIALALVAGWADWVIEAYTSFGGLFARIHAAQHENGGGGVHFALAAQARAVAGPLLCRDGCQANSAYPLWLWWLAIPLLIFFAIRATRGTSDLAVIVVPALCGAVMVIEYTVTVDYAAPRFLIPAYALLALPCAEGIIWLAHRWSSPTGYRIVAGLLALQFASQVLVIEVLTDPHEHKSNVLIANQAAALKAAGVSTPCAVEGTSDGRLAYDLKCGNQNREETVVLNQIARGVRVVWVSATPPSHSEYWSRWQRIQLPTGTAKPTRYAELSPQG